MPASATTNTIDVNKMPRILMDRMQVQSIFSVNAKSLDILQVPAYKDKIYDQKSLD